MPEATPRADGDTTATATDDSDKRPRGGEHKRRSGGERGWAEENAQRIQHTAKPTTEAAPAEGKERRPEETDGALQSGRPEIAKGSSAARSL